MPSAREIILRRRARFLASALSGLSAIGGEIRGARAATPIACATEKDSLPEDVRASRDALERARAKFEENDLDGALETIAFAHSSAYLPELAELEARVNLAAGRPADARAALEARERCRGAPSALPEDLARALTELRATTTTLTFGPNVKRVRIDDAAVEHTVESYVESGPHRVLLTGRHGGSEERRIDAVAGESLYLEIEDGPILPPQVCLTPPFHAHEERGVFGAAVWPTLAVDVVDGSEPRAETNANLLGAAVEPFLRIGGRRVEVQLGATGMPSASARGFVMPLGGFAAGRYETRDGLALTAGLASGYLFAPAPRGTTPGVFASAASPFVEPRVAVGVRMGELEVGARGSFVFSGQEDSERSRFSTSYVTLSVGLTWVPLRTRAPFE